ncbi:Imm49 family immunity protein [Nocardia sp. NPDC051052]
MDINDLAGVIALPLLALACIAVDAWVPVEVTSGYIPKHR